jgi:hypothetical protein
MGTETDAYNELCGYTLAHGGRAFIHQHVVDAWGAQQAKDTDKPIRLVFSLAGLYLHLEKGFTGREVQLAHVQMAKRKRDWPRLPLPSHRGGITAIDVMRAPEGPKRDAEIDAWCASVWEAFRDRRAVIEELLRACGVRQAGPSGTARSKQ